MSYSINPQVSQDSITTYLRSEYSHVPIIPDGLIDSDDDVILKFPDGSVKPFALLWFHTARRTGRGKSFSNVKLDQRVGSFDLVVVANSGGMARTLMNDMQDRLVGWKPTNSSIITEASRSLWNDARSLDIANRPSRWAITNSFEYGLHHTKTIVNP